MKTKNLVFLIVITILLLLLAVPSSFSFADPTPLIIVEFPTPIGNLAESVPIRIRIPNPQGFGYPRVPVSLYVAFSSYRSQGIYVPLLAFPVTPFELKEFLETPIEKVVDLPLPISKRGNYRIVVDVKCLYGPDYRWSYWYSHTTNSPLEILPEKLHIVGKNANVMYGYSLSQSQIYDFLKKGHSFRIEVQVAASNNEVFYTEPTAVIGTFFDQPTQIEKQKEIEAAKNSYQFLLSQYPGTKLKVTWVSLGGGDWRWLFSTQSNDWVEKNGIVISITDLHWSWNPWREFQLEYRGD